MKWCPNCKKEFADEINFCKYCGAKLEEKIIEEKKTESSEKTKPTPSDEPTKEVCAEPSDKKAASFNKKILLAVGIVIILLAAVLLFHGGKQKNDESAEIGTEEQIKEEQEKEDSDSYEEQNMEEYYAHQKDRKEGFWDDTAAGGGFYVPEGFGRVIYENDAADVYHYENEDLGMYIQVWEIPFSKVNENETPQNIIMDDYYRTLNIYGEFVGYSVAKDNFCVCSADDGESIYYFKFINVNDKIYSTVSFEYPVENRETCDRILTEFLSSLEYY